MKRARHWVLSVADTRQQDSRIMGMRQRSIPCVDLHIEQGGLPIVMGGAVPGCVQEVDGMSGAPHPEPGACPPASGPMDPRKRVAAARLDPCDLCLRIAWFPFCLSLGPSTRRPWVALSIPYHRVVY